MAVPRRLQWLTKGFKHLRQCRYRNIEEKLRLSRFMDWTFISCEGPMKERIRGWLILVLRFRSST